MLSFVAGPNLGYSMQKFTKVFVKTFTKSDVTELHFCESNYRLENCYATASQIFRFLRYHSKSVRFKAL